MIVYKWMLKSMHSMCCATKRTTNPGNARSEAELACIWCLSVTYFQTGAAQKSSCRDSCTNILAHQHKNTRTRKHQKKYSRRPTLYDRLWSSLWVSKSCPSCKGRQRAQPPQAMLDQKQNWLVSGAYLSHVSSDWSWIEIITSRPVHKHTRT